MYNVASGPSVYPKVVLDKIAKGILEFDGKEISTLEIGHRSDLFNQIRDELVALTRDLLKVPKDYKILYLQGGGRLHFAQIPMNFLGAKDTVQIVDTGYWSLKALEYAAFYGKVEILASSKEIEYSKIPPFNLENIKGSYLQYCSNNTIHGTQFSNYIACDIPVVVDMSSEIFSRPIDFNKIEMLIACAQKNFGPAGLSLVIIKESFLAKAKENIPAVFSYKNLAAKNSNYNTPPIFQFCASLEMLHWIKQKGGVEVLEKETKHRAEMLYNAIDKSELVHNLIEIKNRSKMNIVFDAINEKTNKLLSQKFIDAKIMGIKGHKARGGFRVGNYIGQSEEAIEAVSKMIS